MPTQIAFSQRKIENTIIVFPTSSKRFKKQFKFQGLTKAYELLLVRKETGVTEWHSFGDIFN